ncbi:MAG: hypothetical protein ACI9MC_000575, partial [Kiritimatiellia bacterium]
MGVVFAAESGCVALEHFSGDGGPMDKTELLSQFQAKVSEFSRFQAFIDKAEAQAGKFAPAIIEKVINSHRAKIFAVVEDLIPLMGEMEEHVASVEAE